MAGTTTDAIGIDLGTTYSCVAAWRNGRVEVLANESGQRTTPSYVSFSEHGRVIGDAAKQNAHSNAANTVFDAKRLIGRAFDDPEVVKDRALWPFRVRPSSTDGDKRPVVVVDYEGREQEFSPEEISAMVLGKMKETAEAALGHAVRDAVITVPAYFNDAQRQATKDAGTIAGLNVLRIINEPTAAAIAYGMDKLASGPMKILVFDLGGGTLDVSVMALDGGVFEVLSTSGDTHLGGEDFDNQLVEHCLAQHLRKSRGGGGVGVGKSSRVAPSPPLNERAMRRLRSACERAKRALSGTTSVSIEVDSLVDGQDFACTLTRARFEELNAALFRKCMEPVRTALRDAKLQVTDIDEVVLVGGSSRIPKIQEMLSELFRGKELNKSIHPDEAVAHGAAVQAAVLAKTANNEELEGDLGALVLVDVTPLTLGIETSGQVMTPIVPRNTPLPATRTQIFSTYVDKQKGVTVKVFEGERASTRDNHLLGKFNLEDLPPRPRGVPQIEVTFSVDVDGILSVTAKDVTGGAGSHGKQSEVKIRNERGRMSDAEIARRVAEAEEMRAHDETVRARVDAKARLESYMFHMMRLLEDDDLSGGYLREDRDRGLRAAREVDAWLDTIECVAAVDEKEFLQRRQDLEAIVENMTPCDAGAGAADTEMYTETDADTHSVASTTGAVMGDLAAEI